MQAPDSNLAILGDFEFHTFGDSAVAKIIKASSPDRAPFCKQTNFDNNQSSDKIIASSGQANNNLENENQMLKSQVEMLKAALLGICKDQNLNIRLFPLLQESSAETKENYLFKSIS